MKRQGRTALVAGAVGRRGEALLNAVLASGDYREVVVLATAPIALGVRGLVVGSLDALPALDDAFIALGDASDPGARSFHGRDAPFMLVDEQSCLSVSRAALDAGAHRMVLISPMPAWQQVGRFHRGLANTVELAISALPLSRLQILRPVADAARTRTGWIDRFVATYLSLQLLMLPKSIQPITSETLARCALAAMRVGEDGIHVHTAEHLPQLLQSPR